MRGLFGTRICWWLLERVTGRSVNCMQHTSQISFSLVNPAQILHAPHCTLSPSSLFGMTSETLAVLVGPCSHYIEGFGSSRV